MAVLSVKSDAAAPSMYSRGEYYPPEYYRRRGLAAKQRAAQSTHPGVKEAFQDIARHWLALAERVEWLNRQHNGAAEPNHTYQDKQ
jgi:hypothetical protein